MNTKKEEAPWAYRVRGRDEWVELGESTSERILYDDQGAQEAAMDHWRRVGQFKEVELHLRGPGGQESFWLVGAEQRWAFVPFRRSPSWDVA